MATEAFEPILVLYAFLAVVQTVLVMVPGFYYARKGTASVDVRRTLSIVSFNLLLPAMNFFNIISQVSASTIVHYLPFAINTVLSNCTGMMLGWGANEVANTPRHLRYHVIAAAGFGNMNSLPLMIVAAICGQQQLPFYQSLGSQCSSVGWGYVALGSAATQILTYPVAIWLLKARPQPPRSFVQLVRLASQRMSRRGTLQSHPSGREAGPQLELGLGRPRFLKTASAPAGAVLWGDLAEARAAAVTTARLESVEIGLPADVAPAKDSAHSTQDELGECSGSNGGTSSGAGTPETGAADAVGTAGEADGPASTTAAAIVTAGEGVPLPLSRMRRWSTLAWGFTRDNVLKPPCIGAGVGVVFGVISPIKDLFVPEQSAPLGFMMGAIGSIQDALIFVTSFVLGAVLSKGPGPGGRPLGWRPLVLVTAIRMLLLPIIGCVIVIGTWKLGWYHVLNPVYAFVLLMQWAVPTANQMQNIASMSSNHEKEMGALVFWQYVAALVAIPGWMILFLFLMDKFGMN